MSTFRGVLKVLTLCLAALALTATAAGAATVANTNDSGPGSLRQAVIDAAPGETINVPAGTYTLTSGEIPIEKSLTIAGAGSAETILRGGNFAAFQISGAGSEVTLSGLAFRDWVRTEATVQGGLILSIGAQLNLRGVLFAGNRVDVTKAGANAGTIQGGLVLLSSGGLEIADTSFVGNSFDAVGADGFGGGVIQGGAALCIPSETKRCAFVRSSFADNTVDASGGSGPGGPQNGGAAQGGVILDIGSKTPSEMRATSITGNTVIARSGPGGLPGIVQGGALLHTTSSLALTEVTIAGNTARSDGVIQGAGAFLTSAGESRIEITSTTVAANSGEGASPESRGGNLFLAGKLTVANTVVSAGTGPAGSENCFVDPTAQLSSAGFNLDSRDQCGFHGNGDRVNLDPQLGPVADNGGPGPTLLPAGTSPLVDQGAAFGLATDARGVQRPIEFPAIANAPGGDGSDIGAVELQPVSRLGFGKLQKNRRKGTATLVVKLPSPNAGTLSLTGKGLKARKLKLKGTKAQVKLVVALKSKKLKKALRRNGKRKVAVKVTYAPTGNTAVTKVRKTSLVKKTAKPEAANG